MDQAQGLRKMIETQAVEARRQMATRSATMHSMVHAPRVIAVTSGKGGVGKTNIVGNLSIAFARLGKKVLIFDADLGLANIDIIFGVNPAYHIGHVLSGQKSLTEIMVEGPEGVRILPAGSGIADLTHLSEGQKLNLLSEFEALEEMVDVFLIDTGAGISSNVLYFNLAADECILVVTDEPTSITDAYAMIKVMYTQHGIKYFKLLVNMVKDNQAGKYVFRTLSQVADRFLNGVLIEYIGYVPGDEMLKKSVLQRKPVISLYPGSESSKQFAKLAADILAAPRRFDADGNIKFFLNRFINFRTSQNGDAR